MAKMKAGEARRQNILNDLLNNDCCTYEYLMNTYQISERSMQMDIKELCRQGYIIKGIKAKQGYVLKKEETEEPKGYFEASDAQKIRKLFLMLILQNSSNGYTVAELGKQLQKYNHDGTRADIKTIQTALDELTEARMVVAIGDKYSISGNALLQLALTSSDAIELLNLLETCSKRHHHEQVLKQIQKKLTIALFNEPEDEDASPSAYVVYNKSFENAGKLESLLDELNQYPFEEKGLIITYQNHAGQVNTIPFFVGNVVYSVDKDQLYLLGECEGNRIIIQYGTINKIEIAEQRNCIFRNEFYRDIIDSMFSISVEEPVHVRVEFDHIFAIKEKLNRLLVNRPKASLTEENGVLYYEDEISGIYDFAAYLRRFGYNCRVLEPESLRGIMKESAQRIVDAYRQLEEEV
ncbi:MAG: WYL domain-containing protein [Lachnospiraceae bacterium]|nr:WYL domain-containing protein [Lachnospiraceae bacterium]